MLVIIMTAALLFGPGRWRTTRQGSAAAPSRVNEVTASGPFGPLSPGPRGLEGNVARHPKGYPKDGMDAVKSRGDKVAGAAMRTCL